MAVALEHPRHAHADPLIVDLPPIDDSVDQGDHGPSVTPAGTNVLRLRDESVSDGDRNLAVLMHLSLFATIFMPIAFVTPIVIWLLRHKESGYISDHGRELTNVIISGTLIWVIGSIIVIGIPVAFIWTVVILISLVRGAMAAKRNEFFRYPMTFRFIS